MGGLGDEVAAPGDGVLLVGKTTIGATGATGATGTLGGVWSLESDCIMSDTDVCSSVRYTIESN